MLSISDIIIGARVRCTYNGGSEYDNKLGTIDSYTIGTLHLVIKWDNDPKLIEWHNLSTLELIDKILEKEKACHKCHKINDTGVSVCWNCTVLDP